MKLSSRQQLLNEADHELKQIIESIRGNIILNEDVEHSELDRKLQRLYILAKKANQMKKTNEANKTQQSKSSDSWRNKPVTSKYALRNLPPTNEPEELKKRERLRKWEEVNQKLIDSWLDYTVRGDTTGVFSDIVVKVTGLFQADEVYDAESLKPIPSKRYPGKTMKLDEWSQLWEEKKREKRSRTGNFIKDLLDGLAWSMMP